MIRKLYTWLIHVYFLLPERIKNIKIFQKKEDKKLKKQSVDKPGLHDRRDGEVVLQWTQIQPTV